MITPFVMLAYVTVLNIISLSILIPHCDRSTRESTPCNLIRDPDTIETPGSTTRRTNSTEANQRIQNSSRRHIPTACEMDEFFAGAEEEQQKQFIDKYVAPSVCFLHWFRDYQRALNR